MLRVICLLVLSCAAAAQTARSVDELVRFIRGAIMAKYDDKKIAEEVLKIKLATRLDEKTITEVQHMGAGQKTVAALRKLAADSASLPAATAAPATPPAPIPPPSAAELQGILQQVKQNALNYTLNLPNYICTQVTKR